MKNVGAIRMDENAVSGKCGVWHRYANAKDKMKNEIPTKNGLPLNLPLFCIFHFACCIAKCPTDGHVCSVSLHFLFLAPEKSRERALSCR